MDQSANVTVRNNQINNNNGTGGVFFASFRPIIEANTITGNTAGLAFDGNANFNHFATIGSDTNSSLANYFAFNSSFAIGVLNGRSVNLQNHNLFEGNTGLAFDLGNDGPTANDPGDIDSGPNNLLNFPNVQSVTVLGPGQGRVVGNYNGLPFSQLKVNLFAEDVRSPTGRGAPGVFLGSVDLFTDSAGDATFSTDINSSQFPGSSFIFANARDFSGNRSEFSPSIEQAVSNDSDIILGGVPSPNPVTPGIAITFNFSVYNAGPADAVNSTVTGPLPPGATEISTSQSQGTGLVTGTNAFFDFGTIQKNEFAQGSLTYNAPTPPGNLRQSFTAASDQNDPVPSNNQIVVRARVQNPERPADLVLEKTVSSSTGIFSGPLSYTIKVTNNGTNEVTNLEITDYLPKGFQPTSVTSGDGTPISTDADHDFVRQLYQDLLGQENIDAAGEMLALGIETQSMTREAAAFILLRSDAHLTSLVTGWYRDYLGRQPTTNELSVAINDLRTDADGVNNVLCRILASDENFARVSGNHPITYLFSLTDDLLGRAPTPAETSDFFSFVIDGLTEAKRAEFIKNLMAGAQFYEKLFTDFIRTFLGRETFPHELDDYLNEIFLGGSIFEVYASILSDGDYTFMAAKTRGALVSSVPPGGVTQIVVEGIPFLEGLITNQATVVGGELDPILSNNEARVPVQIIQDPAFAVDLDLGPFVFTGTNLAGYPLVGGLEIRDNAANYSTGAVVILEMPYGTRGTTVSPLSGNLFIAPPNESFVNRIYRDLANTSPELSDLVGTTGLLTSGTLSHADVAGAILNGEPSRTIAGNALYQNFLGRPATGAEVSDFLNGAFNNHQITADLLISEEYFSRIGATTNFVQNLYLDLLDRLPSTVEQNAFPGPFDTQPQREPPINAIMQLHGISRAHGREPFCSLSAARAGLSRKRILERAG